MMATSSRPAYWLTGPTAVGKSRCAHCLATRHNWALLSADAMLVYKGMDIGTAKPVAAERQGVAYGGLDCVNPDKTFSVAAYLDAVRIFFATLPPRQPVLVVGGTGLYIKALLYGLDPTPSVHPQVRRTVADIHAQGGVVALQAACQREAPQRYAVLTDKQNPRRLMRALELARSGDPEPPPARGPANGGRACIGLNLPPPQLNARIEVRVDEMYADGLLDEVRLLRQRYPNWSSTARQAIGYREAAAVLDGTLAEDDARAATAQRTRRYARRQKTWFRHQLPTQWLDITGDMSAAEVADKVEACWEQYGPVPIQI